MPALPESRRLSFAELLAVELAPREGRWGAATRIAVATTLTVAIAMIFRIPAPEYMAYIVFLISKDDRDATLLTALGGFVAVTLAILLSFLLAFIDMDEPALRILAMALTTFLAMFTTRTFALGQLTFLAGFVFVLLHSLIDQLPSTEIFTRVALWGWVIVGVPVSIVLAIQALFGHDAAVTIRRAVRKVLQELKGALIRGDFQRRLPQWRATLVPLLGVKRDARAEGPGRIGDDALARLLDALTILEVVPATVPAADREAWSAQVDACLRALDRAPASATSDTADDEPDSSPAAVAFSDSLAELRRAIAPAEVPSGSSEPHRHESLLAADAFTNPVYWQFALKTTAAVMASYAIYMLLDWPGIRTAIVTCFFVALSSLGETVHKLLLRIAGALLGGLIAGLCIVVVLPHLTDIGQLCFLIALVALGAAWVATSSELLAYAGLQMAFAFFLGILQGYGPANDLTVLRDRIVGIVVGNIVVTIVFSSWWPESVKTSLRNALSDALRALGSMLSNNTAQVRARVSQALAGAHHFQALSDLELRMLAAREPDGRPAPALAGIERLAGAAFVATAKPFARAGDAQALRLLGSWMETSADRVARREGLPPVPEIEVRVDGAAGQRGLAAGRAIEQVKSEVVHVASAQD
ncbi:MAG: FUSC family protein [Pseudomonadota bacterium]